MQQHIQYCTTPDGVRLAYSIIGSGPPMVRTPHWFAHLEYDLDSPVTRHTILGLAHRHTVLRYDPRGIGMSQREIADISFDKWVQDMETVVDAAKFDRFILFGLSQGCGQAVAYAARHPERVSHLILYGGFARGLLHRENPDKQKQTVDLARALVREGWGSDEESHRQFFTSQFIPDGTSNDHHSLNEMQRRAATPEMAERYLVANANINVVDLLAQVKVPTLILHPKGDLRVPFSLGQEMAAAIAGAKFVPLDSRNHLIPAQDPAHRATLDAVADFLGEKRIRGHLPGTAGLSERLEHKAKALEQNWLIKFVLIFAAITGCLIFFWEIWKMWRGAH
jgi:pimeloyl-ACP methyl ester carboxylesterase